jgi:hypothetical protein
MDFAGRVGRDVPDRFCRSCRGPWRIKKNPPTPVEAERLASQVVMNESSLHKGDLVSTDRGLYRGPWARRLYQRLCPRSQSGLAEIPVALFKTFLRNEANGDVRRDKRLLVWESLGDSLRARAGQTTHLKRSKTNLRRTSSKAVANKRKLFAGRNQNVMRLVLIKLITAVSIELEASPLRATVDYSERNSPLQYDT